MVFSDEVLEARRRRVAGALGLTHEVLVVGAGQPIPLPEGSDQTYPFRSDADYFYLTGLECPGGVVAFDPDDGWHSFVPRVTEDERVWEGREQPPGEPADVLPRWLASRLHRPLIQLGAPLPDLVPDPERTAVARERFLHARRPKDAAEVALLRRAATATAAGYAAAREMIRAGVTERALQIELESAFARAGARRTGYGSIVGAGSNSAVLHFEPTQRSLHEGDFVLIDAGAEVDRYVCDVTRTFAVGPLKPLQREIHDLVRQVQEQIIRACRPKVEWKDLHLQAALHLTEGLVALEILRGDPGALVEQEAHRLFFPHGLGHLVGLGVRDASGTVPGRARDPRSLFKNLRTDLPLEAGYVITVEPGLYFIPPLLQDPVRRQRYRDAVNWNLVDRCLDLGGVRLEDNVLVTDAEPDVLTREIPKVLAGP